ncbi:MAG: hypothetical protein SGPRY_005439 [Prymnesium sp.]
MGSKQTWSIGKARNKPARPKQKPTRAVKAKGFGSQKQGSPPAVPPAPSEHASSTLSPTLSSSTPDENDLAAVAAAAGGEAWRAYAEQALAQVQQLEEEAARTNCSPEELLRRSKPE